MRAGPAFWVLGVTVGASLASAGCDVVFGLSWVRRDAGPSTDDGRAPDGPASALASCKAILTATPDQPSGSYYIDPDGSGGDPPVMVHCDMTTDGGGWTIMFLAGSDNLMATPIPYTVVQPDLLATAQEALISFRTADLGVLPGTARFPMPIQWRNDTPFDYPETDLPIMTSIDGATMVAGTLRYGHDDFATDSAGAWDASTPFGRVCIDGTSAPFFSAFATADADWCSDSASPFNTTACSADRRFSIAVR
jgi:hypothetical protein